MQQLVSHPQRLPGGDDVGRVIAVPPAESYGCRLGGMGDQVRWVVAVWCWLACVFLGVGCWMVVVGCRFGVWDSFGEFWGVRLCAYQVAWMAHPVVSWRTPRVASRARLMAAARVMTSMRTRALPGHGLFVRRGPGG